MNNQYLEFLKSRRSIRKFKPDMPPREVREAVFEAATYAPTAKGAQSPIIVMVEDEATRGQLMRMNARVLGKPDEDPYYGAPLLALVFGSLDAPCCVQDASCVLTYMQLAAHAAGLAACWINREREMFETEAGKELMKAWNLPDRLTGVGAVALGYADCEPPKPAVRKPRYIVRI